MFFNQQSIINWLQTNSFVQLSVGQYGGTFVDWSINYLSDVGQHTVVEFNGYGELPIPTTPIASTGSAHQHIKNHSGNPGEILWQWHFLHSHRPNNFHTFYMHMPNPQVSKFITNSKDMIQFTEYMDSYNNFIIDLFSQHAEIPHVVVYPDFDTKTWACLRRYRTNRSVRTFDDLAQQYGLAIDSESEFSKEEIRERLALASIPYYLVEQQISHQQLTLKEALPNCYSVGVSEIFNDLETVLKTLQAKNPSIKFNNTKWHSWRDIYTQWRDKNIAELNWCKKLDTIIYKIINQQPCSVGKLSEFEELAIETELLLKGYSIKNFGLKNFPSDLALLELEPSVHQSYINELINAAQIK